MRPDVKPAELAGPLPAFGPELYAGWRNSALGALTDRLERAAILDLMGDVADRRILDVGCGDGELALELWRRGAEVSGIDLSESMIEAARARAAAARANVRFAVARAECLPFAPERFDVVVAVTILCFVEDASPVFNEVARVLRPGGRLVIGELGKWSTWAAARRLRAWLGSPIWRKGRFRTARELRALAEQAGLRVEAVRGAVFFPRCALAARLLAPGDARLGGLTTIGAAFIALAADRPVSRRLAKPRA